MLTAGPTCRAATHTLWAGARSRARLWERKATPRRWTRERRQALLAEQATDIDRGKGQQGLLAVQVVIVKAIIDAAWATGEESVANAARGLPPRWQRAFAI